MTTSPPASLPALLLHMLRPLRGPNVWRPGPVVCAELAPETPPPAPGLRAALEALDPGFGGGAEDGGEDALAPLAARLALRLQQRAGAAVEGCGARPMGGGRWELAVEYETEPAGVEALREAARLLGAGAPEASGVDAAVERLAAVVRSTRPRGVTAALLAEARRRGIPVRPAGGSSVQLGIGRGLRRVRGVLSAATPAEGVETARTPDALQPLLVSLGIPVPIAVSVPSADEAAFVASQTGYPVTLRPLEGAGAGDPSPPLAGEDALRAAWPGGGGAVLSTPVPPAGYRALVVGGRLRGGVEASPPHASARVHPDAGEMCERIAGALGLPVVEVGFHAADPAAPWPESGAVCTRVDANPSLEVHPPEAARDAASHLLDRLFPGGAPDAVPVVAVTGTNGKTTTARLIQHFLALHGRTVALQHTEGVYLGERLLVAGDPPSALAAPFLLCNPEVEAAVFETARGGILSHGLPVDRVDVGVVTNVSSDHLGEGGVHTVDAMAEVKSVVVRAVHAGGHAVLNAEDPRVLAMRERVAGRVALFSAREPASAAVAAHLEAGGVAAVLAGGRYALRDGAEEIPVAAVEEVPLAFGGAAVFQHENVLAALAAGHVLGVPPAVLREGVLSFHPTPEMNRGRMNLLRVAGRSVVVDYGHNVESLRAVAAFARAASAGRRIAVVGMSASRRDEDILACGAALAPGFDHVILRERDLSTHRPDGEVAGLLARGLAEGGLPPEQAEIVLREPAAVARALALSRPGDLVVLFANNVDRVLAQVAEWSPAEQGVAA